MAIHQQHRSHLTLGITQQGQTHTPPFQVVKIKASLLSHETSQDVQLIDLSPRGSEHQQCLVSHITAAEQVKIVYSIKQHRTE